MNTLARIKKAVRQNSREVFQAVKNSKSYVVPFGHNWENMTPVEKKAALDKQKQVRGESVDEGFFGPGSTRPATLSDYPHVHAYATGIRHQSFSDRGDVQEPKRKHVVEVGKKKIPIQAHQRIKNFEDLLRSRGHGEEGCHVMGTNHGFDFGNNPTKHDEVLVHAAADLLGKRNTNNESHNRIAMHGIAAVRALTGCHKSQS